MRNGGELESLLLELGKVAGLLLLLPVVCLTIPFEGREEGVKAVPSLRCFATGSALAEVAEESALRLRGLSPGRGESLLETGTRDLGSLLGMGAGLVGLDAASLRFLRGVSSSSSWSIMGRLEALDPGFWRGEGEPESWRWTGWSSSKSDAEIDELSGEGVLGLVFGAFILSLVALVVEDLEEVAVLALLVVRALLAFLGVAEEEVELAVG